MEKSGLKKIKKERIKKLKQLKKLGIDPYPAEVSRTNLIKEIIGNFEKFSGKNVSIAGRITSKREHGRITFYDIEDESGKIQLVISYNEVGEKNYKKILPLIDIGDFLEATGEVFKTKKGEKSVKAKDFKILAKSILPIPKKWFGLKEKEERYRKRYLDLILNKDVKKRFILRSKIIKELRAILEELGFMEVETPILQSLYGGANAEPFITYLNALDLKLYLRIAPELYLKRLIIGGYEKIYEIGKNFRNEGIDKTHNPEFSSLELYWAYHDENQMMELFENIFEKLVKRIFNTKTIDYKGKKLSFKTPWKKFKFIDLFEEKIGIHPLNSSIKLLKSKAKEFKIRIEKDDKFDSLIDKLYKKVITKDFWNPTYVIDIPTIISPLAKNYFKNKDISRRFQGYIAGIEVINGFSELNDPIEQEKRFKQEQKERKDPHPYDKDFIEALCYGMPPCAGIGVGIDRLVMILTNSPSIKEAILFPFMREK